MSANALDLVAYRSTGRVVPFTATEAPAASPPRAPVVRIYPERRPIGNEDFVQAATILVGVAIVSLWVWPPNFFYYFTQSFFRK